MADEVADGTSSRSPREDYDPLRDFAGQVSRRAVYNPSISIEDNPDILDDESPCSSIDLDSLPQYSITPPVNSRALKRERQIHASHKREVIQKDFKLGLLARRNSKNKDGINVIRDDYSEDPDIIKAESPDALYSADTKDGKERKRRDSKSSKKTLSTSRSHERFMKMNTSDIGGGESRGLEAVTTTMLRIPVPLVVAPIQIDTTYRFRSLNPTPVNLVDQTLSSRRPPSVSKNECPNDRKEFYQIFSTLINMGSHAKKEKDQKVAAKGSYMRQKSCEQEIWQTRLNDMIWLELQAWHSGRHFRDEDDFLVNERGKVHEVLSEIMNFKLHCDIGSGLTEISPPGLASILSGLADSPTSRSCLPQSPEFAAATAASFQTITLTEDTIQSQRDAMQQVEVLLERLEMCERLYPTLKSFAKNDSVYSSVEFRRRVKALYLWLNVTRDLCRKMKEIGIVLGVQNVIGAIDWPWMDYQPPKEESPSSQNIYTPTQIRRVSIPEVKEPEYRIADARISEGIDEGEDFLDDEGRQEGGSAPATPLSKRRDLKVVIPSSKRIVQFSPGSERNSRSGTPVLFDSPIHSGCSTPTKLFPKSNSSLFQTLSRASSELCLDDLAKTSVYRHFVDKSLKKMGMNKLLLRLRGLLHHSLQRAKEALERPKESLTYADALSKPTPESNRSSYGQHVASPTIDISPDVVKRMLPSTLSDEEDIWDWNKEFLDIGLPSFRPSYLFLTRIKLDVIHECLRLRLEQRPTTDPSFLSIRQLIRECKEVLRGAVHVKQYYQHMVSSVLWDDEDAEENFASSLEQFDADMRKMLEFYFSYLQNWMYSLQNLPEASRSLKNALEVEWTFTKKICPHVGGGEAEAGKRFSTLASSLLSSISDFLEQGMDECTAHLFDMTMGDSDHEEDDDEKEGETTVPESERDHRSDFRVGDRIIEEESVNKDGQYEDELDDSRQNEEEGSDADGHCHTRDLRHSIQQTCRDFKNLFHEARERASKAQGFAKMLRKDLEIAADFNIAVSIKELFDKLHETKHIRVIAPTSAGYLMFIPDFIVDNQSLILQLLNVTCGREGTNIGDLTGREDEGYLLMVRCEGGADHLRECPMWRGSNIQVEPTAETTIALSHIEVDGLLLVVIHSSQLGTQRRVFERVVGETVELVNEQTSCHQKIAEALDELKNAALNLREKVVQAIKQVDEKLNFEDTNDLDESERNHILKLYRETMLQCYNFGFEYHKEVTRLVTGEARHRLGRVLIDFALDWMRFVSQKCERGRGMRPRWASQGLDFLTVACEPKTMTCLTDDEFQNLKQSINDCISHVIGSADRTVPWSPAPQGLKGSNSDLSQRVLRNLSWPSESHRINRSVSSKSHHSEPAHTPNRSPDMPNTPESRMSRRLHGSESSGERDVDIHDGEDGGLVLDINPAHHSYHKVRALSADPAFPIPPSTRRIHYIQRLEDDRTKKLREKRVIGRVTDKKSETDYHISVRRVNFKWQRGMKIGEGQFGKVYTAVNMDTGELMAMKEMRFLPNDHQAFKGIADEIRTFESIEHKNLVKYYGVEVHKDELLIFMEFCDRGTIEDAAKLGLPEQMIRKYTHDILVAINILHENNIVHRDIKGANIFLTSTGCLKLGDFGCSVRLKSHTTMPGEVNALVGTTAYMAPEVIARNGLEGHGRAADIWSLGCVVLEMVTGKRPWHEFENNYQIMFKVGMGSTPPIPEHLSAEGKEFLAHCFKTDPTERSTASQLQTLLFTMVNEAEDFEEAATYMT